MNLLEKCAEILVECGYAQHTWVNINNTVAIEKPSNGNSYPVDPFTDTLEGIHQFHAIEDWIRKNKPIIWAMSSQPRLFKNFTHHEYRLNRTKWCVVQINYNDERKDNE